jgi:hypothetical protein
MTSEIICSLGKCIDPDDIGTELDSVYDDSDIVKKIQKDLLKNSLGE